MSEEGECVVLCCFSRGFDLLVKQEEQVLDLRKDFASGHGPRKGTEKSQNEQRQTQFPFQEKNPTWVGKGRDFSGQEILNQKTIEEDCFWQQEQNHNLSSGKQVSKGCHIFSL